MGEEGAPNVRGRLTGDRQQDEGGGLRGARQALVQAVQKPGGPGDRAAEEQRRLRNALCRVKYRITRLFELYEQGELDKATFSDRMAGLAAERTAAQAELGSLTADDGEPPTAGAISPDYQSLDGAGRREFLRTVVQEIVVNGQAVELALADLVGAPEPSIVLSLVPYLDTTTFAGRLRRARLAAGLRQEDVARILGVGKTSVWNWECGRGRPRRLSIEEIERVLVRARPVRTEGGRSQGSSSEAHLAPKPRAESGPVSGVP